MQRFNLKKLNKVEGKEQFRVEVSHRFAALKDLDTEVEINSAWEMIRENTKFQPKRLWVTLNLRSIRHGSTKNDQNY
jgi:hypothetical protein